MTRDLDNKAQAVQPQSHTLWARGLKRGFDILVAGLMLLMTSPVWLPAAILIKLTSPGPLFFVQERSGRQGRIFHPLKFRSMRGGRRPDAKEIVALDHPEVTAVGKWIRRLKIDELPQLLNVLRGEMSLVGPRPTLPDQVAAYDDFRRQRLLVRPGLTGLAQVHGNTTLSWDERILYDIAYVRRCSFGLDIWIMLRTLWVVLRGEARMTTVFGQSPFERFVEVPAGYGRDRG